MDPKKKSERELMEAALFARQKAYAPYSGYLVGAALLDTEGNIHTGCNVENSSYGATNCAERSAVFRAVGEGKRIFTMIAIAGGTKERRGMAFPCGVCRQVLREFCDPKEFTVLVGTSADDYRCFTLEELIPYSFGPDFMDG